jgi:hypothetical protein
LICSGVIDHTSALLFAHPHVVDKEAHGLVWMGPSQAQGQNVPDETDVPHQGGTLLLHQADPDAAQVEACFQQALALARHQEAKSWELCAATSLARLWQAQDKRQDAYDLLAPVYEWFAEGFGRADLREAKQLLKDSRGFKGRNEP